MNGVAKGLAGGIDLGGTKIDARLFDPARGWAPGATCEWPTPRDDYDDLIGGLARAWHWLKERGAATVGLAMPGIRQADGRMLTANLAARGRDLTGDLEAATSARIPALNDARAFVLSEAVLGAGRGHRVVAGLVIGTGVAGGLAFDGQVLAGQNGIAGEIGHLPVAPRWIAAGMPSVECGCGRQGCWETLVSGPGIRRIADAIGSSPDAPEVETVWAGITADLLGVVVHVADPEVIVLGGGVSRRPGLRDRLADELGRRLFAGTRPPRIALAEGGDRSGARGAALHAHEVGR